jgi:hypothetical protein
MHRRLAVRLGAAACGVLFSGIAAVFSANAQSLPRIKQGTPYGDARKILMSQGYKPVSLPGAQKCGPGDDDRCFPEAFACAGTGTAACIYTWQRGAMVIEVRTRFESPEVSEVRCRSNCR